MKAKPAVLLPRAERDIDEAVEHDLREGGANLALEWVDAVESALRHVAANPGTGSTRYAAVLGFAGLRFWPMKRFPYLVFYIERDEQVDVWRLLHANRDIPESLDGP